MSGIDILRQHLWGFVAIACGALVLGYSLRDTSRNALRELTSSFQGRFLAGHARGRLLLAAVLLCALALRGISWLGSLSYDRPGPPDAAFLYMRIAGDIILFLAIYLLTQYLYVMLDQLRALIDATIVVATLSTLGAHFFPGFALPSPALSLDSAAVHAIDGLAGIGMAWWLLLLGSPGTRLWSRLQLACIGALALVTVADVLPAWLHPAHMPPLADGAIALIWACAALLIVHGVTMGRDDELPAWTSAAWAGFSLPPLWRSLVPYCCVIGAWLVLLAASRGVRGLIMPFGTILATELLLLQQVIALLRNRMHTHTAWFNETMVRTLYSNNLELSATNRQLEVAATTDALTGLSSRSVLYDRLRELLPQALHTRNSLALLLMDLNRFKEVNDTLGHHCGDLLLEEVSARLRRVLQSAHTIARLGGDEFAIVLPATDEERARRTARDVLADLEAPFRLEGHTIAVGASIGIALAPSHGTDTHTLLRCADVAMYVAKRTQSGCAVYAAHEDEHSPGRLGLVHDLRRAISNAGLELHYQPKVDVATSKVCGVEALARFFHPHYGPMPPDQFIPLAEQSGLIGPLTEWVLVEALQQCQKWQAQGNPLSVAVNLSTRMLHDLSLPEMIADLLDRYNVAPPLLTLEITESLLIADPIQALEVIGRLDQIGVRIAIDDFGAGYSSLSYLKQLPVDEVKIDKSFLLSLNATKLVSNAKDRLIVRAVTALAHALGLEVVAEGVETRAAWELLSSLRCDAAQGYFISKPLSARDLDQWLALEPIGSVG